MDLLLILLAIGLVIGFVYLFNKYKRQHNAHNTHSSTDYFTYSSTTHTLDQELKLQQQNSFLHGSTIQLQFQSLITLF